MADETKTVATTEVNNTDTALAPVSTKAELEKQSGEVLQKIINEKNPDKLKDLSYLFNLTQNKKTMARVDKCNDVLDNMLQQWAKRVADRPDEMSHDDILKGIKTIQDLMEKGQRQVADVGNTPLIQLNQQTNEIHIGDTTTTALTRESRDRIKNAISGLLANLGTTEIVEPQVQPDDTVFEVIEDGETHE